MNGTFSSRKMILHTRIECVRTPIFHYNVCFSWCVIDVGNCWRYVICVVIWVVYVYDDLDPIYLIYLFFLGCSQCSMQLKYFPKDTTILLRDYCRYTLYCHYYCHILSDYCRIGSSTCHDKLLSEIMFILLLTKAKCLLYKSHHL